MGFEQLIPQNSAHVHFCNYYKTIEGGKQDSQKRTPPRVLVSKGCKLGLHGLRITYLTGEGDNIHLGPETS